MMPLDNVHGRRLSALRERMRAAGLTSYFIPTADAHQSEYVPAWWRRREWISGFTGSQGSALVTATSASLVADSRYWLQAGEELDSDLFLLVREGDPGWTSFEQWLRVAVGPGALRIDPMTVTIEQERR